MIRAERIHNPLIGTMPELEIIQNTMPSWWLPIWAFTFATCLGSFTNVLIVRMPQGQSIVLPRSACPKCQHRLNWWENIPLLSYLCLRRRCSKCEVLISPRYFYIELIAGCFGTLMALKYGLQLETILWLLAIPPLLAIAVIDFQHFWIPDQLLLPLLLLGGLNTIAAPSFSLYNLPLILAPAGLVWGIAKLYSILRKKEGLGFGDIKLLIIMGLWLGPIGCLHALTLASLQGLIASLLLMSLRPNFFQREPEKSVFEDEWTPPTSAIPFGPFLILGLVEIGLFGERVIESMIHWLN